MVKNIFVVCLLFVSFSYLQAQENSFQVQILQNGVERKNNDDVYLLKNAPFSIKINAKGYDGFLVGATFDRDIYLSALGEADLEVLWFENTGMAEGKFNADRSLFISDDAPSYWYYDGKNDHRFDRDPAGIPEDWKGQRTIDKFDDLLQDKIIKVSSFNKSVYLYLYNPIYNDDYELVDIDVLFHAELRFANH